MGSKDGLGKPPDTNSETGLSKRQIFEIFETSFNDLSEYLLPIVGKNALEAIFRNAHRQTRRKHPILASTTQSNPIPLLDCLKSENVSSVELLRALLDYMQSIVELLTELTGDVLAKKAKGVVSVIGDKLGENHHA